MGTGETALSYSRLPEDRPLRGISVDHSSVEIGMLLDQHTRRPRNDQVSTIGYRIWETS